ncbi:ATP-binding protein [Streptomyces sp. NBC_01754]|uniref:ATP-binding protein n=1 Tax=Streptomyces sp. NBC_01754 TaxID=2975930 RepID=UPI002DDC4E5D|nr:ATP-binding protein [Streptomyces sp. NBC_01754]WSC96505.1 ATP-binding protein [Streptomyces sp. NBC_01754]
MHAENAPPPGAAARCTDLSENGGAPRERWAHELGVGSAGFATHDLDTDPESLCRARAFVRASLERWGLESESCADDVALVAGELASNAVCHALPPTGLPARRPTAWLGLARQEGALVCAVNDPSPDVPVLRKAETFLERGRGLRIIDALSSSWGWSPACPGKTVWARIPVA